MPWCPNCRNEYKEGTMTCADCGADLVADLKEVDEKVLLFMEPDQETAEKFVEFLKFSNFEGYDCSTDEDGNYEVFVRQGDLDEAKKLMVGFATAMAEKEEIENLEEIKIPTDSEEAGIEEEKAKETLSELRTAKSSIYISTSEKYKDFKFSGYSFIGFSILGIILIILNYMKVFSFLNPFSMIIMAVVFVIFGLVGVSSLLRASKIKPLIGEEESKTDEITNWIHTEFTPEYIESISNKEVSEEKQYFEVIEILTNRIKNQFPDGTEEYLEQLVDDYYNDYLEQ